MRTMKDSGIEWIGEIPLDWGTSKMRYIGQYINGYAFKPDDWSSEGKRIIRIQDLTGTNNNPNYYAGQLPDKYNVTAGDILVSWAATLDAFIWNNDDAWLNQHIFKAICFPKVIDKNFFFWVLKEAMENMNNDNKHGIVMQHITLSVFSNFTIPLPPKLVQRRIANYLDRKCGQIDTIIARQQEVIEKLKAYKLSVITEAVTKGLNPDVPMKDSGIPWVGNICNHYALSRVGAFCFVTKLAGFEYTDIMSSAISDTGEVPIVRAQNVRMFNFNDNIDEYIGLDVSQKLHRCALNKKCLLITFIGAGIGDVCVFSKTMRYHLAPNVAKIEIRDEYKTILDEEYLMFYLGSLAGKGEISKISKASAQPSLSMGTIRGITIAVPPIDEQREISEYLSKKIAFIDKVVRDKESIIENLLAYKSSLIYEVVTGKKEV